MNITFRILDKKEFTAVYQLMQLSFPPAEYRTYEEELALFERPYYRVLVVEENGTIQAFIAEWALSEVHYVEHFAVNPVTRGKGLGTKVMREYLKQAKASVIIEVEAEETLIASRRIAFYERLGFVQSNIKYIQPNLQKISKDVLLRIMYYPAKLSENTLYAVKREIYQTVYA